MESVLLKGSMPMEIITHGGAIGRRQVVTWHQLGNSPIRKNYHQTNDPGQQEAEQLTISNKLPTYHPHRKA